MRGCTRLTTRTRTRAGVSQALPVKSRSVSVVPGAPASAGAQNLLEAEDDEDAEGEDVEYKDDAYGDWDGYEQEV